MVKRILPSSWINKLSSLLLAGFVANCSWIPAPPDPLVCLQEVSIILDTDANMTSATAVDVVIIYDEVLLKTILAMDSQVFYAALGQIKRDFPSYVDIWHWELTPGQVIRKYPIHTRQDEPRGAVIFANYHTPGVHRIRLGSIHKAHVHLKKLDFCVIEQGCFDNPAPSFDSTAEAVYATALGGTLPKPISTEPDPGAVIASVEAAKQAQELAKNDAKALQALSPIKIS